MAEKKPIKPNPYNNPIAQALIDIKRILWDMELQLTDIDDIIAEINSNAEVRERAVKLWFSHKIPDKSIKFIMSLIYDGCPERYELPIEEQAILGLMERIQNQTTGAVSVHKAIFTQILHLNDKQRKSLQTYLDHLTAIGFLTCIYRPPRGSKKPGIYVVNRAISWIGTETSNAKNLKISSCKTYRQISETFILPDGTKMICGALGEKLPNDKKRASADQNTDSTESHIDSEPHSHSTESPAENQAENTVSDNNNMQKISSEELLQL